MSFEAVFAAVLEVQLAPLREELRAVRAELEALRRAVPPQLVSMTAAAKALGLSLSTVRRRVRDGSLSSKRVGRSVRVDLAGLRSPTDAAVNASVVQLRTTMPVRRASGDGEA